MRVIHYTRTASSQFHIHTGSYATCFYVPDAKVILFVEQHGSSGSTTRSLTDRQEMLEEAQIIAEGKKPNNTGVRYSPGTTFDYDNEKLQTLITNARSNKDLETHIQTGIDELLGMIKPQKEALLSVDPHALDQTTRKRLQHLVQQYVRNDHQRHTVDQLLYPENAAAHAKAQQLTDLEQYYHDFLERRVRFGPGILGYYLALAQQCGSDEYTQRFAEIIIATADSTIEERIEAATILHASPEIITQLREVKLVQIMTTNWSDDTDYLTLVEQHTASIPPERVRKVARTAYTAMLKDDDTAMIRAAQLAKTYLDPDLFHAAARQLIVKKQNKERYTNTWEQFGKKVADLQLPPYIDRPFMLSILSMTYQYQPSHGDAMIKRYAFNDDELATPVNIAYQESFTNGNFASAFALRHRYSRLITDQNIPLEDLQLLAGIQEHACTHS